MKTGTETKQAIGNYLITVEKISPGNVNRLGTAHYMQKLHLVAKPLKKGLSRKKAEIEFAEYRSGKKKMTDSDEPIAEIEIPKKLVQMKIPELPPLPHRDPA